MIDAVVTGGSGFIGTRLLSKLRSNGAKVLALSSQDGDVADSSTWAKIPPSRVVFHLAGRSYVPDSWHNSAAFLHSNVIGTEQALSYCRRTGAGMVLASAYVYGIPKHLPISESDVPRPNNPYALSKWMAEELGAFASIHHQVNITALRIFNVFGPGQREVFLIPTIINQVRGGEAIQVQDLVPKRDYVYLEDVVDAFILAAASLSGFKRFNIGSAVSFSVAEIIETVQRAAGTSLPVISVNTARPNEIADVRADIGLARTALGWTPKFSFEDGIKKTMLGHACEATPR
jgi:GDP-4-dehydro-6-deoxy-D-mannose reductase